ncbi:hypothetical protein CDAR_35091 [Caerostris darwini]|uniref:Ycf15 n=1 Tax=Caerostris darwini TaxID=1538125 RepID=A0AAV4VJ98_9ARAC|nr:hypothetical protein CDAR_35091 [Caerostris darwini]
MRQHPSSGSPDYNLLMIQLKNPLLMAKPLEPWLCSRQGKKERKSFEACSYQTRFAAVTTRRPLAIPGRLEMRFRMMLWEEIYF